MDDRSNLKDNPYTLQDGTTAKVYIGDDLTKRRATLAFKARQLRNDGLIQDTWITNYKILVKNKHGRISQIYVEDDLKEFLRRESASPSHQEQFQFTYMHTRVCI